MRRAPKMLTHPDMRARVWSVLSLGALMACSSVDAEDAETDSDALNRVKKVKVTAEERGSYIAKGNVWLESDPSRIQTRTPEMLLAGPEGGYAFNEEITCDFVEPNKDDQLGGMTPKFECKLPSGKVVKVKYAKTANHNREVFSEVISSRLMWALGLAADAVYPVHVTCNNCPEEPWAAHVQLYGSKLNQFRYRHAGPRATRRFDLAAIEVKFGAPKIEGPKDDGGWSWKELPQRPDTYWRGTKAERDVYDQQNPQLVQLDALRLFASWVKHADNKADNQRMVCLGEPSAEKCDAPLLMVHDMGISFGGGTKMAGMRYAPKALLADWTNLDKNPVWKNFSQCKAELDGSFWTGTMTDPRVSPAGQRFLVERLAQLTDEQLRAIFTAARVELSDDKTIDATTNQERNVNADDWVAGFKQMREVVSRPCPDAP
jgi:hypothetical protein